MKKSLKKKLPESLRELYETAKKARLHSYSPYSRYRVGAAIRLKNGEVFSGCNIENSTYGATTCAEQIAVFKAISESGKIEIKEVLVITDSTPPAAPCGICRQVIAEFGLDAIIYVTNLDGDIKKLKLKKLLPEAFTPDFLQKA